MHVIASTEPTHLPASVTADARLVWIVVIHVMPTSLRR